MRVRGGGRNGGGRVRRADDGGEGLRAQPIVGADRHDRPANRPVQHAGGRGGAGRSQSEEHPPHRLDARVVRHAQHLLRHDVDDARHRRRAPVDLLRVPTILASLRRLPARRVQREGPDGRPQQPDPGEHRQRARVVAGSRHEPRRRDERTLRLVRLRQPQRHERLDLHRARRRRRRLGQLGGDRAGPRLLDAISQGTRRVDHLRDRRLRGTGIERRRGSSPSGCTRRATRSSRA